MFPRSLPVAKMLQEDVRPPNTKSWRPPPSSHSQLERKGAVTAGDSPKESAVAWEQAMDSPTLEVIRTKLDKVLNNAVSCHAVSRRSVGLETSREPFQPKSAVL